VSLTTLNSEPCATTQLKYNNQKYENKQKQKTTKKTKLNKQTNQINQTNQTNQRRKKKKISNKLKQVDGLMLAMAFT